MTRKYEFNAKHASGRGNISKMDLSDAEAQQLLNSTTCFPAKSNAWIGVLDRRRIFAFRMHSPNTYHGYPISGNEVCSSFPEVQSAVAQAMGVNAKRLSRMR